MAGRETAFRQMVAARQRALLRTAYLLTQSEVEAQDLVQEALTRTYARLRSFTDPNAVESYVRRCMVSIFIDAGRRQTLFVKRRHSLTNPESTTTVDIDAADDRDQLRALLNSLPRRQRTCVVLRFYEDLSVEQTARLLGWAPGTVKRETHDALQVLRKAIGTVEDTMS
jgi:RNA polymerase sigma-70 factor (sigma-E family)